MDFFTAKDDSKDRLYIATAIMSVLVGQDTMALRVDNLNSNLPPVAVAYADLLLKALEPKNK